MAVNLSVLVDRLTLRLSTDRKIDGLWIGSMEDKPRPGLRKVEDALQLIKDHDSINYRRVLRNLDRVWINLVPHANACYQASLNACVFDERFFAEDTTTVEQVARIIVHEATHARLQRLGIDYLEGRRIRIEAICVRRELAFATKLPDCAPLRDEIARTLGWLTENPDYFSDVSAHEQRARGSVATLHYLGTPDWVIKLIEKWHNWRWRRSNPPASS